MPLAPLPEPSSRLERLHRLSRGIPIATFLGSALLGINALQMASLAIKPVSRATFRRFNRGAADTWWGFCVTIAERVNGTTIVVTGDEVPPLENTIVVANHQQMPDITFLMQFARTKGRLGDLKWFVKKALKYVPGVGWGMVFLDCLFVERRWTDDQDRIAQIFHQIVSERIPLWLITFVEGTRMTPEKVTAAQAYARDRGFPPTDHVLVPRTKGFVASVQGLRDHIDAVYDVTIGYEEGVPSLWQYAKGQVGKAHLHVRRYPVADLPNDPSQLADWLFQLFQEKDDLLAHYYEHGAFPAGRDLKGR
ncbi:MAG: acyltransferase [Deltaproteobacteria bacterium]|nr:acyltransferase [Deltaproteobacteria bacterium]